MVKIAPSILSVEVEKIESEVANLEKAGADYIHIDVMDGEFVPNRTAGTTMLEKAYDGCNLPLDTHLMVENPEDYIEDFSISNILTFHVEAVDSETAYRIIDNLHEREIHVGMAIKPNTSVEEILPYLDNIELVLVMLVEPGFGGQEMIEECLEKVRRIRELRPDIDIEVDGGINLQNIDKVKKAGANVIVSGTAILKEIDRADVISKMKA